MVQIQPFANKVWEKLKIPFKSHMVQIQQWHLGYDSEIENEFKSHMVQIQLLTKVYLWCCCSSLNPTWFRYNYIRG